MDEDDSQDIIICSRCNAENSIENNFCLECGKPIKKAEDEDESSAETITCPQCNSQNPPDLKFCTECGTKIEEPESPIQQNTCPECNAELIPGNKFCTICGAEIGLNQPTSEEIYQRQKEERIKSKSRRSNEDQIVDSVVSTGKDIMKGIDGLLNKATSSLENKEETSSTGGNENRRRVKPAKKVHPGYLVCNKCEGYYELEPGESADDFSDECTCGGRLEHHETL